MNLKMLGMALLLASGVLPAAAQAQDPGSAAALSSANRPLTAADLEGLRAELRSSRKQIIASTLKLTDAEATRFWPVYDRYAADLTKIKNDQYELIAQYANTYGKYDDKAATAFITRWVEFDVRTTSLRARYLPEVGKVLPGVRRPPSSRSTAASAWPST